MSLGIDFSKYFKSINFDNPNVTKIQ